MTILQPVILCGGSGTRLWPASRKDRPKPFLPLLGTQSLLQDTATRVASLADAQPPIVVAGDAHAALVRAQTPQATLVVEPAARNTAPAIALAAHLADPDAILLVCPSDHHIADGEAFARAVATAIPLASEGCLVSIGVLPTRPETGYGYIELGETRGGGHVTARFVEKPDAAKAESFIAAGNFVWNAGIFVLQAGAFLRELAAHRPAMASAVAEAMAGARQQDDGIYPLAAPFATIEGESIDYAVMEPTRSAAVVVADMGWSDIGDWSALAAARGGQADAAGNLATGPVDLIAVRNCMVESDGPRVSLVGVDDIVVVVHEGEVLVTSRAAAQSVGKLPGAQNQ